MRILDFLESRGIKYRKDVDTAAISSIKVGGIAKTAVYPRQISELCELIAFLSAEGIRYKVIGRCSNVYFFDGGYDGVLISTSALGALDITNGLMIAECGAPLGTVIRRALEGGYRISSELSGIPGSIGGAVYMNAGAYGASISDIFESAEVFNVKTGQTVTLGNGDMNFSYRSSLLQSSPLYILRVSLRMNSYPREKTLEEMRYFLAKRKASQPNLPSLGSFFKAFEDISASKLIDDAGLKGASVGGASVSKLHAGFIVNNGGATAKDVNALAAKIEDEIMKKYSRRLQREAEFCE